MKNLKFILSLAAALVVVSAAICAVVIFQEELYKLFRNCTDYCCNAFKLQKDEQADFADMG